MCRRYLTWGHLAAGVAIVVLALFVTYAAFAAVPGAGSYVVASGSMGETAPVGSLVFVIESDSYQPGDVVTYREGDQIVTHRVVERTAAGYVTKGDANDHVDDGYVTEDEVIGELVFVVPGVGYVVGFANTTIGFVLLVVVPGVTLLALELERLGRMLDADGS